ncbi:MAG: hypothetical protein WC530_07260 [Candidatus Omnitrophota bacterium]|jgi:hypothetical protein
MKTVVILGAGCSKGLAGLPADENFVKFALEEHVGLSNDYQYLDKKKKNDLFFVREAYRCFYEDMVESFGGKLAGESLEIFWNEIDENYNKPKIILSTKIINSIRDKFAELAEEEDGPPFYFRRYAHHDFISRSPYEYFFMFAGWQLRKKVAEVYGLIADVKIKTKYQKLMQKILTITDQDLPFFINFNYDTLLEQSLANYHYWGLHDLEYRNGRINIIKPHGSLNWLHKADESITEQPLPIPINEVGYYGGQLRQHSIIGLVANKREFESPSEQDPVVTALYSSRLLKCIKMALRQAERIIVIGYSFPITDTHIRKTIAEAKPEKLETITFVSTIKKEDAKRRMGLMLCELANLDLSWTHEDCGVEYWLNVQ